MSNKKAISVLNKEDKKLTFYYDDKDHSGEGEIKEVTNSSTWNGVTSNYYIDNIHYVEFDKSFADYKELRAARAWFCDDYRLKKIIGIENLNLDNVRYKDCVDFFIVGCQRLENVQEVMDHLRTAIKKGKFCW